MIEKKQKNLKALVQTRSTIKKKFQKLHNKRVKGDQKLKEKYAPITDSIQQLIEQKKEIIPFENNANNDNAFDDGANIDLPNELDDMSWDGWNDFNIDIPVQVNTNKKNKRIRRLSDDSSVGMDGKKIDLVLGKKWLEW